ncbi:MAG TPA: BlaI/MecI/CopY family transcriptional regulator, partial [Sphingomicrobium sp.]|nr:BlaI/MecI/CopY family transcriptional regulator [Sphingomicrobium sp.]
MTDKRISDAELDLMEALWAAEEPLTSADVAGRLEARGWSLATIKTMLSRLVTKGAISHRQDGRRFLYSPAIEREAYVGSESKKFVERLFGGR